MPTKLKNFLHITAACLVLTGFAFYREPPTEQAAVAARPLTPAQVWALKSMTDLDQKLAPEGEGSRRVVEYQACVRRVLEDYGDDPVRAYAWIRTLCLA